METSAKLAETAEHIAATPTRDFERVKDEIEAQTRAFFGSENQSDQRERSKEAIGDLLLFEFEQVAARSKNRTIHTQNADGATSEFILRDCGQTKADERFRIEYNDRGEITRAICETDFGFEQDPPYRVAVEADGSFAIQSQIYHYDDGCAMYEWRDLPAKNAQWVVDGFMEQTTTALHKYYERLDSDDDSLLQADESALAIARRLTSGRSSILYDAH